MKIGVFNAGSSSLKFKLLFMPACETIYSINIENIGEKNQKIKNHAEAFESIEVELSLCDAIGHRVVHGGEKFTSATLINDEVITSLKTLHCLAPLHNPINLLGIQIAREKAPKVLHVAVFDTAFHASLPKEAYLYALPYKLYEKYAIRRYGFHGSSHSFISKKTAVILGKKLNTLNILSLHLGNGASICAIKNGKSIDTSMGFTPLEGLLMGTRSGDIDPQIVLYMQKELGFSIRELETILNKESGLMGICNENDVRKIIIKKDDKSVLALKMMIRRIQKYIASYMVLLESVDAIVFSGGIGENSSYIRDEILNNRMFKGIKSLVVKTDEELEIANECMKIINKKKL